MVYEKTIIEIEKDSAYFGLLIFDKSVKQGTLKYFKQTEEILDVAEIEMSVLDTIVSKARIQCEKHYKGVLWSY